MKVRHARRAALVVLSLLKADTFVGAGAINALRLKRLLWAKTQLRRLVLFAMRARQKVGAGPVIEPPVGEPTPVLLLGHDEYGRGEIIDMTPADEPTRATAYARHSR